MNTTTNWSAYRPLTASEQELFQNLLGKELGVEALLVSLNDSDKKFTEYIFMYNHPDPSTPNLVSFYAKVENKKETVVEFATAQLTERMVLKNLKNVNVLGDTNLEISIAKTIDLKIDSTSNKDQNHINCFEGSWAVRLANASSNNYILTCYHNVPAGKNTFEYNVKSCNYKGVVKGNILFPEASDLIILEITTGIEFFDAIKFEEIIQLPNGSAIKILGYPNCDNSEPEGEIENIKKHSASTAAGYSGGAVSSLDYKVLTGVHQGDDGKYIDANTVKIYLEKHPKGPFILAK